MGRNKRSIAKKNIKRNKKNYSLVNIYKFKNEALLHKKTLKSKYNSVIIQKLKIMQYSGDNIGNYEYAVYCDYIKIK